MIATFTLHHLPFSRTKLVPCLAMTLGLMAGAMVGNAADPAPAPSIPETAAQRDARMAWWREARFGMFIHWGIYAKPAGIWNGKKIAWGGEWIQNCGNIPVADYAAIAPSFNPVKFDAKTWVQIAKDAGMRYVVITAKHHDGFAMYPSKASPFNIKDATPFKRDPLKELADACRKAGLKLGFYYSQSQDWHHPGGTAYPVNGRTDKTQHWDAAQNGDMDHYIDTVAVPQVRELLTNYGKDVPAVLWWDTPVEMTSARAQRIHHVVQELRPDLITNNRLGGGFYGDTESPEQHIPPQGYPGKDWETCMTMNETWGYQSFDNGWKSTSTLIRNLCDIASKAGNYLLNVGPTAEGVIPQPSVDGLAAMGAWMHTNGEAIYGTGATPFGSECGEFSATEKDKNGKPLFKERWEWRCTTKPGKLYLLVFAWPTDGHFVVPGLLTKVTKATLLADRAHAALPISANDDRLTIKVPTTAPDAIASVIVLDLAEPVARTTHVKKTTDNGHSETGIPAP